MSSIAIGIDLGTTNTVAAFYDYSNNAPKIITNADGDHLTPSLVFYDPHTSEAIVGKYTSNPSLKHPRNYIYDIKRIIGRSYNDVYVQNEITKSMRDKFAYKIVNTNNCPSIALERSNEDLTWTVTPEEVSSEILKSVKAACETLGFHHVENAVISVPAYFSYAQRAATKRAAEKAGFKVLKMIGEPVAAAMYYAHQTRENQTLLVVDLGGGTLDVSVIESSSEQFKVRAIDGDLFLGGLNFDEMLFEFLKQRLIAEYNDINLKNQRGSTELLRRLKKQTVICKHALSTYESFSIVIDGFENDYELTVTRTDFEKICDPLFRRIRNKIEKCLAEIPLTPASIDKVVLVGGATRMKKLKEILTEMFNGNPPSSNLNPDEVVALGASIQAAAIIKVQTGLERYKINDVAPYTVGLRSHYELMIPFIKKGTALPATCQKEMQTSSNYQDSINFQIYQGERKFCKYNQKLANFTIREIPPGPAGTVKFDVTFTLDENGILKVHAFAKNTVLEKSLEIEMHNLSLCDSDIFVSPEREQEIKAEDEKCDKFYTTLILADHHIQQLNYLTNQPGSCNTESKQKILQAMELFQKKRESLAHDHNVEMLKAEFDKLKADTLPLINH